MKIARKSPEEHEIRSAPEGMQLHIRYTLILSRL